MCRQDHNHQLSQEYAVTTYKSTCTLKIPALVELLHQSTFNLRKHNKKPVAMRTYDIHVRTQHKLLQRSSLSRAIYIQVPVF